MSCESIFILAVFTAFNGDLCRRAWGKNRDFRPPGFHELWPYPMPASTCPHPLGIPHHQQATSQSRLPKGPNNLGISTLFLFTSDSTEDPRGTRGSCSIRPEMAIAGAKSEKWAGDLLFWATSDLQAIGIALRHAGGDLNATGQNPCAIGGLWSYCHCRSDATATPRRAAFYSVRVGKPTQAGLYAREFTGLHRITN